MEVAQGEVLRGGDPATVLVAVSATSRSAKGDLVALDGGSSRSTSRSSRAPPGAVPENMRVMAFTDAHAAVGPRQVVALNKGARDGVENGQVYSVFHPGEFIARRRASTPRRHLTAASSKARRASCPRSSSGHVMIFRTFDKVSYGLVMDGIRPVHFGDVLRAPVY